MVYAYKPLLPLLSVPPPSRTYVSSANPPAIAYPIMALLRKHTAES
ncbi:hypothetical protein AZE42_07158 [Rhizopogon vesiculosus]|uniref:Uncharacterized protein n=1 Tax=Rhizopogon vesiculosus TaxID=180088 RepID=A0A1J8QGN0_9AGAM|nr:hypothetical protein AZE42_07158 [Rhizopogon vesiculosus]